MFRFSIRDVLWLTVGMPLAIALIVYGLVDGPSVEGHFGTMLGATIIGIVLTKLWRRTMPRRAP
jgi:hypothetical protein